jgi:hypothetical protein
MGVFKTGGPNFEAISDVMSEATSLWMNATIEIYDPNLRGTEWDEWTNEIVSGEPILIWSGIARVQPIRNADVQSPQIGFASSSIRRVRIQAPLDPERAYVRPGFSVKVTDAALYPDLEQLDLIVTTALNSTYAWLSTIDCDVNAKV